MAVSFAKDKMKSSSGENQIACYFFVPDAPVNPKAILQISHGMCEYFLRYEDFARYMAANGFIVCGNDHLGHGDSSPAEDYGYFGNGDAASNVVEDVHALTLAAKKRFPGLPCILLGHSMGSFIARGVIGKYGADYAAAIISGTAGKNPLAPMGKMAVSLSTAIHGEKYRSELIKKLSFGNYTAKISDPQSSSDWITRDSAIVKKYDADPKCNFKFTNNGYKTLFNLLCRANEAQWFASVPENLPIFLVSGDADPVGNYGKGVREVYDRLIAAGKKDVSIRLYPDGRHEMLNELNRAEVYEDIRQWIEEKIK